MNGGWALVWMMVVLKVPIAALLYIVWYAAREVPAPDGDGSDGGNMRRRPRNPRGPSRPRPPRRGPHAGPEPRAPERTRVTRGRTLEPSHRDVR